MWLRLPRLTHPTRAWAACSAGRTRSRRGPSATTASITARSAALALGPTILRSIGSGPEPLDANRGGLELGRPGLGIGGVDGEHVRDNVVLEVHRHEGQARAESVVRAHRHLELAAPGADADDLALAQAVPLGVLRRHVEGFAIAQRRGV